MRSSISKNAVSCFIFIFVSTIVLSICLRSWIPIVILALTPVVLIFVAAISANLIRKGDTYIIITSSPEHKSYREYIENNTDSEHKSLN